MAYTIKIYEDNLVVYIKRKGKISVKERIKMVNELNSMINKKYCFILDSRGADLSRIKKEHHIGIIELVKLLDKKIGPTRCVILVNTELEYGIERQFSEYIQGDTDFHSEFEVYYNIESAKSFIEKDDACKFPEDIK